MQKILGILHLAGQSSGKSYYEPMKDLEMNTLSTLNLINYCKEMKLKKFMYASSMTVYGEKNKLKLSENMQCSPMSCYGNSKKICENYLQIYKKKIPYISLRMFNVYGPGQDMSNLKQGMMSIYLAQAINTKNIHIKGNLERARDFIFIDDVVEIWFRLFHLREKNYEVNVGSGKATTVKELVSKIKILLPGTKSYVKGKTPNAQFYVCSNNKKLTKKLKGFKFSQLDSGLKSFFYLLQINDYS